MSTTTPNMSLTLPTPGDATDFAWGTELNTALSAIDRHNHAAGSGIQVSPSGLNINADLPFGSNNATGLRSVRMVSQGSALALAADLDCLYVVSGDLYYNNGGGTQIQLTSGGAINAASVGGIGGDYATSTASESYSSAAKTFSFTQDAGKAANLDAGYVVIREPGVVSAKGISVKSPTGLGADYTLTLPAAAPGSTLPVVMSTAGVLSAANTLTLSSLTSGSATLTSATIGSAALTNATISAGTATLASLTLAGLAVSTSAIAKAYARIAGNGTTVTLEQGFNVASVSLIGTGTVRITFTAPLTLATYVVSGSAKCSSGNAFMIVQPTTQTTGYTEINLARLTGGGATFDMTIGQATEMHILVFGV